MTDPKDPVDAGPKPAAPDVSVDVSPAAQHPAEQQASRPSPAPREPGRVREFFGHRATQLVGVGLAGLLIGGGAVALHDTVGRGDQGRVGFEQGFGPGRGEAPRFERRGPRGPFPTPRFGPRHSPRRARAPPCPPRPRSQDQRIGTVTAQILPLSCPNGDHSGCEGLPGLDVQLGA